MIDAALRFFAWLFGKLTGKPQGPSAEAVASKDAGVAQTGAAVDAQTATTQAAIAQAEADGPRTKSDVVTKLDKGTF